MYKISMTRQRNDFKMELFLGMGAGRGRMEV